MMASWLTCNLSLNPNVYAFNSTRKMKRLLARIDAGGEEGAHRQYLVGEAAVSSMRSHVHRQELRDEIVGIRPQHTREQYT
jgi:hypothetical protein